MRRISIRVGSYLRRGCHIFGKAEHLLIIYDRHVNVEHRWKLLSISTQQKEIQVKRREGDGEIYLLCVAARR
jgi:hypothetical protein